MPTRRSNCTSVTGNLALACPMEVYCGHRAHGALRVCTPRVGLKVATPCLEALEVRRHQALSLPGCNGTSHRRVVWVNRQPRQLTLPNPLLQHPPKSVPLALHKAPLNQTWKRANCSIFPFPGGPKSHNTEVKPMSTICFESQSSDLELLKCCAALSECRQSGVSFC